LEQGGDMLTEDDDIAKERRWAKARQRAEGLTEEKLKRLRPVFRVYLPAVMVLVLAVSFLIGTLFVEEPSWSPSWWQGVLSMAFSLTAAAGVIGGIIYVWRKKFFVNQWDSVAMPLEKEEQRRIKDQIRGREPVSEEELSIVRGAAIQVRQSYASFALIQVWVLFLILAQLINGRLMVIWILLGLVMAILYVYAAREFRQAGRFLQQIAKRESSPGTGQK
jgi:hypothetical protein